MSEQRWYVFDGLLPDLVPGAKALGLGATRDPMEVEPVIHAMAAMQGGALLERLRLTTVFGELNTLIPNAGPKPSFRFAPAYSEGLTNETPGEAYIAYLFALECAVRVAEASDAFVVNMSFGLDPTLVPYDPEEPFNRATWAIADRGGVVVTAAGNFGPAGLSPWSRPPWVIAVGASDAAGKQVAQYSSIGNPVQPDNRPWVVASGQRGDGLAEGTSFAAPRVSMVAMLFTTLLAQIARLADWPPGELRKHSPTLVKKLLAQIARPLLSPLHIAGAGWVDENSVVGWLSTSKASDVSASFPVELIPTDTIWRRAIELVIGDDADSTAGGVRTSYMVIDRDFWWSRNAMIPGFWHRSGGQAVGYTRRRAIRGSRFDAVGLSSHGHATFELEMRPVLRRGQVLRVGPGEAFERIGDAIKKAQKYDVILISPGTYTESLLIPSDIAIVAADGKPAIVTHSSKTPLLFAETRNVYIEGLTVVSTASSAVSMLGAQNVEFNRCRFQGSRAVSIARCSRVSLQSCVIKSQATAICLLYSYSIELDRLEVDGASTALLAFGSAVGASRCSLRGGISVLAVAPVELWPELSKGIDGEGRVPFKDLDTNVMALLPLAAMFDSEARMLDSSQAFMDKLRTVVLRECELGGQRYSVLADQHGLVALERCNSDSYQKLGRLILHSTEISLDPFDLASAQKLMNKTLAAAAFIDLPREQERDS